jgi:hypothetical protein
MHIADINLPEFFSAAFPSGEAARAFVDGVERLNGPVPAKLALHQAARMLWLADHINEFANGRPALQILFYLIIAEAVAKIAFGFRGEGRSRTYVRRFFAEICSEEHRRQLSIAFSMPRTHQGNMTYDQAVDILYDVRCDVVHEARYFGFHLAEEDDPHPMLTHWGGGDGIAHMTLSQLRRIILEGSILAVKMMLAQMPGL